MPFISPQENVKKELLKHFPEYSWVKTEIKFAVLEFLEKRIMILTKTTNQNAYYAANAYLEKNCGFINTFDIKQGRMKINKPSSDGRKILINNFR